MEHHSLLKDEDSFYDIEAERRARQSKWKRVQANMPSAVLLLALILSMAYSAVLTVKWNQGEQEVGRLNFSKNSFKKVLYLRLI